ncbi:MAG: AAA family ATPase [Defluviitaleaceae bacterium]|nr:AAA family ATPase [Defluviitaleaceae bacterium]
MGRCVVSDNFDGVRGNAGLIDRLRQTLSGGFAGGAYVFCGGEGTGKKTVAEAFAKALQCEGDGSACCACLSCRVLKSGNHPDVVRVIGSNKKSIGVEDVRDQAYSFMCLKPFRYRYQIVIIDKAETLTPNAQNALLKKMEEPSGYGIIMLLASRIGALLPTVLSRCVVLRLNQLSEAEMAEALTFEGAKPEAASFCAKYSGGSLGIAKRLALTGDFEQMRLLASEIAERTPEADILGALAMYRRVAAWKEQIQRLLDMLYLCFHDRIVGRCAGQKDKISLARLFDGAEAVRRAKASLEGNGNFQMSIEAMLLAICGRSVNQ